MPRGVTPSHYEASVTAEALCILTSGMSDGNKSSYLWTQTTWPKPTIGYNGRIEVPDPAGETHYIEHRVIETTDPMFLGGNTRRHDEFECLQHRMCWALYSAIRAYRLNTGIEYETNTGQSIYSLPPSRGD